MARATTRTILPLDRFATVLGIHPLHYNQVMMANIAAVRTCGMPITQHSWQQADRVGREEIANAIDDAERALARELGYDVGVRWNVDDRINFRHPQDPALFNRTGLDIRGMYRSVRASHGYVISGGIETKTLVDDAVAIVYTDDDSDTYFETATITVTVPAALTDPEEVAIYYPGEAGADEWEIRPIGVTISGTTATITCRREQLVRPNLLEALDVSEVDGSVAGNFLTTVDVYRHYNDPQRQVQFMWEQVPNLCDCGASSCGSCSYSTQDGCATVRDYRNGIVALHPADWSATDEEFSISNWVDVRGPDRARLWYRAGYRDMNRPRPNLQMDAALERAVTYLALTYLDRKICTCSKIEHVSAYWAEDLARIPTGYAGSRWQSGRMLDNPLGTSRGALYAWKLIQNMKLGEAVMA